MLWRLLDRWLAPPPDPHRVSWLRGQVFAHRGWHGEGRIENSPSAFVAALGAGLGIECDVQQSADGAAMVFHDWELDRLTAETGLLRVRTSLDLGDIELAGSTDQIWPLSRLLAESAGRVPLLIELKSSRGVPFEPLCTAVRSALANYAGPVAVMSFDPRVGRWFSRHAGHLVRGLVMTEHEKQNWRGQVSRTFSLWRAKPHFLAYDIRDLPSRFAASQRKRGLPILTWTVSDRSRARAASMWADSPIAEGEGLAVALKFP